MYRAHAVLFILLFLIGSTLSNPLNVTLGRAYFRYNEVDSINLDAAYTTLLLGYYPQWSWNKTHLSFSTANTISKDDPDAGNGIAFSTNSSLQIHTPGLFSTDLETGILFSLIRNPDYAQSEDGLFFEAFAGFEKALTPMAYLRESLFFKQLRYPDHPQITGNLLEMVSKFGCSFESGRSASLELINGTKEDDAVVRTWRIAGKFSFAQSLGDNQGVSGYLESNRQFGTSNSLSPNDNLPGILSDPYLYDGLGMGARFKRLSNNLSWVVYYDFEYRFFASNLTEKEHLVSVLWTRYFSSEKSETRWELSIEPSLKWNFSSMETGGYSAFYLTLGLK